MTDHYEGRADREVHVDRCRFRKVSQRSLFSGAVVSRIMSVSLSQTSLTPARSESFIGNGIFNRDGAEWQAVRAFLFHFLYSVNVDNCSSLAPSTCPSMVCQRPHLRPQPLREAYHPYPRYGRFPSSSNYVRLRGARTPSFRRARPLFSIHTRHVLRVPVRESSLDVGYAVTKSRHA